MCSGKIYYDLLAAREERTADHIAIVRLEQLYPFLSSSVNDILLRYPLTAEVIWRKKSPQHGSLALPARTDSAAARFLRPRITLRRKIGEREPGDGIAKRHQQSKPKFWTKLSRLAPSPRKGGSDW